MHSAWRIANSLASRVPLVPCSGVLAASGVALKVLQGPPKSSSMIRLRYAMAMDSMSWAFALDESGGGDACVDAAANSFGGEDSAIVDSVDGTAVVAGSAADCVAGTVFDC